MTYIDLKYKTIRIVTVKKIIKVLKICPKLKIIQIIIINNKINSRHSKIKMKFQISYKIKKGNNLINKISKVLFENKTKNENQYFGRDEYFNSVIVKSEVNIIGKIKNIKVLEINQNTLFGEVVSNLNQKNYAA